MSMTRESLIEWASSWANDISPLGEPGQRARFKAALAEELKDWKPPAATPVFCKHCPFAKFVHYEQDGKLVTPTCPGFEPEDTDGAQSTGQAPEPT